MPDLIRILSQIHAPAEAAGVELVLFERILHHVKFDDPLRHFDPGLTEFVSQNRQQLWKERTIVRAQEFELEFRSILVADTITVVIFPTRFVEQFGGALGIVWQGFDVSVEVSGVRIEWAYTDSAETVPNLVDQGLPVHQHCQSLAHPLVFKEWPVLIPSDEEIAWNRVLRLHKLLVECRAARLLGILHG